MSSPNVSIGDLKYYITISDTGIGIAPEDLKHIFDPFFTKKEKGRKVRSIGLKRYLKNNKEALDAIYADFENYFKEQGGFKKEENVLEELGGKNQKPYVLFLLTLGDQFSRVCEKKDFNYFWSILPEAQTKVKETLNSLVSEMQKIGKPVAMKDFHAQVATKLGISEKATLAYLEVSKRIQSDKDGFLGLIEWPEIKPRGVKDKAFLVFKKDKSKEFSSFSLVISISKSFSSFS
jgi:hypothetical protein